MAGNTGVSSQADIVGIPGAALSTLSFTQGLLRAVSADNVCVLAVQQVQAIGSCFQSNGLWAAKLPDLLSRTSSVRLERLSTWIGWAKDDTSAFMSRTPGGRTAALLCYALGSLYPKIQCGMILHDLSLDILPPEGQTSSPKQLGDVCMILESKLGCLGFGNHLAHHVTRIRQCFFEVELETPRDLVNTPSAEDMHAFLNKVRDALQDESLVLRFSGTHCSAIFLALILGICPEDVTIQVNGEVIMSGLRENLVFSVMDTPHSSSQIHLESKLTAHTTDFRRNYISDHGQHGLNEHINYSLDGILSSRLDIALAATGAVPNDSLKLSVANLVASMAMTCTRNDFSSRTATSNDFWSNELPAQGFRVSLGPAHQQTIRERLQKVLGRPSDILQARGSELAVLEENMSIAMPLSQCICGICANIDQWRYTDFTRNRINSQPALKSCPVYNLWSAVSNIAYTALLILFIQASPNSSVRFLFVDDFAACFWAAYNKSNSTHRDYKCVPEVIHNNILLLVTKWRRTCQLEDSPRIVCGSSNGSTVYPNTIESPRITNPWAIQYELVDGRLHYRSDCYEFIISAMPGVREAITLSRLTTKTSIRTNTIAAPSRLGEHSSLMMTLRPAGIEICLALMLQCDIQQGNSAIRVDFLDVHLGFMSLTPADACEHDLSAPLTISDCTSLVKATSVIAPAASRSGAIGITMTHQNEESQFLCCSERIDQLYQGDCCIPCAVAQAEQEGYSEVIGGSPSAYCIVKCKAQ